MFYINRLNSFKKSFTLAEICVIEPQHTDLFVFVAGKFPNEILDLGFNSKKALTYVHVNFQKELDHNGNSERVHTYVSNGSAVGMNNNSLKNWK